MVRDVKKTKADPFSGLTQHEAFVAPRISKARRMTARENEVLDFAQKFFRENDQLPPEASIAKQFGWSSANSAHEILMRLERRGAIERNAVGKWRFSRQGGAAQ